MYELSWTFKLNLQRQCDSENLSVSISYLPGFIGGDTSTSSAAEKQMLI